MAKLGQAVVASALPWLNAGLTEEMTGSKSAGRLALAISAIYPSFIYYSGMLMSEPLYLLFVTGGLWALWREY